MPRYKTRRPVRVVLVLDRQNPLDFQKRQIRILEGSGTAQDGGNSLGHVQGHELFIQGQVLDDGWGAQVNGDFVYEAGMDYRQVMGVSGNIEGMGQRKGVRVKPP